MACPRCGGDIRSGDAFCARCGMALLITGREKAGPNARVPSRLPIIALLSLLCASIAIAVGVHVFRNSSVAPGLVAEKQQSPIHPITEAKSHAPSIPLASESQVPSTALGIQAQVASPPLQAQSNVVSPPLAKAGVVAPVNISANSNSLPSSLAGNQSTLPIPPLVIRQTQTKEMPTADLDWLMHLQRCETTKQELTSRTDRALESLIHQFSGGLGDPNSRQTRQHTEASRSQFQNVAGANNIYQLVRRIAIQWTRLQTRFDRFSAPSDCQDIALNYDEGLSNIVKTSLKIDDIVNGVNALDRNRNPMIRASIRQLESINASHPESVDVAFKKADRGVQSVCEAYGVKKWFTIDASGGNFLDGGSGGAGSMSSLLGALGGL